MAKKRVHEIAKERGISSKEVIAVLQKAGLDVKASASSVDENDIAMAFNGGKAQPTERGDRGGPRSTQRPGTAPRAGTPGASQPSGQRPGGAGASAGQGGPGAGSSGGGS